MTDDETLCRVRLRQAVYKCASITCSNLRWLLPVTSIFATTSTANNLLECAHCALVTCHDPIQRLACNFDEPPCFPRSLHENTVSRPRKGALEYGRLQNSQLVPALSREVGVLYQDGSLRAVRFCATQSKEMKADPILPSSQWVTHPSLSCSIRSCEPEPSKWDTGNCPR